MSSEPDNSEIFPVSNQGDVTLVKRKAKELALNSGFNESEAEEVSIAAIELSGNIIKHAQFGSISIANIESANRKGIQIETKDKGPGFSDIEKSMTDGFSTSGTLGYGLGSVNRLMDELNITSDGKKKTIITARKWIKTRPAATGAVCPYDIGAATRAHPKMNVNGDSFVIKHWGNRALAVIIDGVGHGQFAHHAASAARMYVEKHFDLPLEAMFTGASRACRATRGVVMAGAVFEWDTGLIRFASVGNIEVKINENIKQRNFNVRRGIVGLNMPKPLVNENKWEKGGVIVMQTDGITSRWEWKQVMPVINRSASVMAQYLTQNFSKDHDDATAIVIKERKA